SAEWVDRCSITYIAPIHCHVFAPCSRNKYLPKSYGMLLWTYHLSPFLQHPRSHISGPHPMLLPVCGSRCILFIPGSQTISSDGGSFKCRFFPLCAAVS